jgi:nucleoid DNA-binding protein
MKDKKKKKDKYRIKKKKNPEQIHFSDLARRSGLFVYRCPNCGKKTKLIKSLRTFLNLILEECKNQNKVMIRGFGNFNAYIFKSKNFSSMIKSEANKLKDRLVIRFSPSPKAKRKINER